MILSLLLALIISFYNIYLSLLMLFICLLVVGYVNISYEKEFKHLTLACAFISVFITFGILMSLMKENWLFFQQVSFKEFLFGYNWSPENGEFGILSLLIGTLTISFISCCFSFPLGLLTAIYLAEYSSDKVRNFLLPLINLLSAIPTIVYGLFTVIVLVPFLQSIFPIEGDCALIIGFVIGIMSIPIVSSISYEGIKAVPKSLYDASYGLGSNKSETIVNVIIPSAMPNILSSFLLALSRAIGETMIVVIAAGLNANLTFNPMHSMTTITVQIVSLLTGDLEFDNVITLSAFALAMTLFFITVSINIIAIKLIKRPKDHGF